MDKWMPVVCDRKERHCLDCASEKKRKIKLTYKERKRDNIQKGAAVCTGRVGNTGYRAEGGTWHMDQRGLMGRQDGNFCMMMLAFASYVEGRIQDREF